MESGRVKNLIIVILLLLDGVLLALVGTRQARRARSAGAAVRTAVQVLEAHGLALDEAAMPGEMELAPLEVSRQPESEAEGARALLGGEPASEEPGGGVLRYRGPAGYVQFHGSGEFQAVFEPGAFPLEGQSPEEHGAEILRRLGFEARVLTDGVTDGTGTVTFRQTAPGGVPVLGCQAALHYADGSLVRIGEARRLMGRPVRAGGKSAAADPATVLTGVWHGLESLGAPARRILSIRAAYECAVSLSGVARLTPVWLVTTDAGEFRLDAAASAMARV